MRLKTGYSFNANELFANFNIKNIQTSHHVLKEHYKTKEKKEMAVKVFLYAIYLILLDIIKNNVTFVLPTSRRSQIQMAPVFGEKFEIARKNGKFKDIDLFESNFTGYQLEFRYTKRTYVKKKPIYVNSKMKKMITDNTNKGMRYV